MERMNEAMKSLKLIECYSPKMDSADANTIKTALDTQAYRLKHHDAQLSNIAAGVKQLTDSQADLQASVATKPPPAPFSLPVSSAPVRLASPPKFSGESGECRPFLIQCDLHFSMDPNAFASEQARVAFMVSHMTGRAAAWVTTAEWSRGAQVCQTAQDFSQALLRVFDQTSPARKASSALLKIQQGCRRVVDYVLEFRTLAADSGWNETSTISAFIGLAEEVKDFLAPLDIPKGLRKPSRNSLSHRQSPP
ncbi:hypothetical protein L3Q82_004105 [Scortum barcoo]|uniref:Uncharacterized protein n=1 Tax=Scortum barcoo TaxID=214431 RepID=A0ACB8X8G8_9TELE|nr:hypothetical protein L3Q82_004105 [Scortum barcoo]